MRRLRHEFAFLRDRRRLAAILILSISGAIMLALLIPRGDLAGSDARAYWAGVRLWLDGGNPFDPPPPFLPYVYFPWSLILFVPWALFPWDIAWFVWRASNVLLFLWSVDWMYRRRPLAAAIVVAVMTLPLAATLDTGNVTLYVVMAVWGAQFVGPRLGGLLWAMAAALKWFPALLIVFLPPRHRAWGAIWLTLLMVLSLATLEQTLIQIDIAINFPRPIRLDYILLLYAAIPWLWRQPWPLRLPEKWRDPGTWRRSFMTREGLTETIQAFFGLGPGQAGGSPPSRADRDASALEEPDLADQEPTEPAGGMVDAGGSASAGGSAHGTISDEDGPPSVPAPGG